MAADVATAKGRVMVVEDDDAISDFLCQVLVDEGYEVLTASDGQRALDLLGSDGHLPPSVVLLDLQMTNLDGWGFLRAYRTWPGSRAALIVVTAGSLWPEAGDWGGVDAVVSKPFDLDSLLRLVARYAGRN